MWRLDRFFTAMKTHLHQYKLPVLLGEFVVFLLLKTKKSTCVDEDHMNWNLIVVLYIALISNHVMTCNVSALHFFTSIDGFA